MSNLNPDNQVVLRCEAFGNTANRLPIAWYRQEGQGRVFYTGLGHRDDVWASARFQNLLVGGIRWALGQVPASVKPNIATVTPPEAQAQ
jgi:type 1 glutamine amidotransferase